jgi:hypothetical protein
LCLYHPLHTRDMAGSPLKRQRKLGIRAEDGSVIAFPHTPRVAELPPGWRHWSPAEKIKHLIGLDRCYEILSWPIAELDPFGPTWRPSGNDLPEDEGSGRPATS